MPKQLVHRFQPSFDPLEDRLTPAGNVTASVVAGTLRITGDALANAVLIAQSGFKQFKVIGSFDANLLATSINGTPNGVFVANNVTNVSANLNAGDDELTFDAFFGPLTVPGNVSINMGAGNNNFSAVGPGNFLSIFGNLTVINGAGNSGAFLEDVNIGGAASFNHAATGNSNVDIRTSGAVNNSWKSLNIANGTGDDFTSIADTNFIGSVTVNNGPSGMGGIEQTLFKAFKSPTLLNIGGNVAVTSFSGTLVGILDDYNVGGNVTMNAGSGSNNSLEIEVLPGLGVGSTIKGNVSMLAHGKSTSVLVGSSGVPLEIDGGLTVNLSGSQGFCGVSLAGLTSVGNSSLAGRIIIIGGSEIDSLDIDNGGAFAVGSTFKGAVSISTGAGNDTVRINGGLASTTFLSTVSVNQGAGDDSLEIANKGFVAFHKTATFNGGATDVNNTILENLAFLLGSPVLPKLIHYHP
jgi:hypothetical protein